MSVEPKNLCPACGGDDLTQGFLTAIGRYGGFVKFTEKPKYYKVTTRDAVQARRCNACGDLELFMAKPKPKSGGQENPTPTRQHMGDRDEQGAN